jgi:type I restriction enzyme S subunit
MSFPRYPEYKASGVEWLGDVPKHWAVPPCRTIVTERITKNHQGEFSNYLSLMANIGVIPYEEKGDIGNNKPEDITKCKLVFKGDYVINSMNYYIGSYGISKYDGICSPIYIVLSPNANIVHSRYGFRIFELKAFQEHAQSFGNGILEHRRSINWDILKIISISLPPLSEQQAIADFLDRETAKIDGLIEEQRRLVELLKEKRQAVISHAVTKGLNPNAPMKPSGIEWLGDIPEHWLVGKCGFYISILSGYAFRSVGFSHNETHTKLLRGINVGVSEIKWNDTVYWERTTDDGLDEYILKDGDLVIGMDRPLISEGIRVAKISDKDLPSLLLQRVASIKCDNRLLIDFLYHFLSSPIFIGYFEPETTGVSVPHISPTQIENFAISVPTIDEQLQIVKHIELEYIKINGLISEAEKSITLLQERRTALISAAVTGKIDVRCLANLESTV